MATTKRKLEVGTSLSSLPFPSLGEGVISPTPWPPSFFCLFSFFSLSFLLQNKTNKSGPLFPVRQLPPLRTSQSQLTFILTPLGEPENKAVPQGCPSTQGILVPTAAIIHLLVSSPYLSCGFYVVIILYIYIYSLLTEEAFCMLTCIQYCAKPWGADTLSDIKQHKVQKRHLGRLSSPGFKPRRGG